MSFTSSLVYFLIGPTRFIENVVPDVVISEKHSDSLKMTEHPVQRGSPVTDHAYKDVETLEMEFGWSKGGSRLSGPLFPEATDLRMIYRKLLDWQKTCQRLTIGTGKREYTDMLVQSLKVNTDAQSENVLRVTAVFRKIHIVDTEDRMLVPENQANPEQTAQMTSSGERQPRAVKGNG